ncbi:MAG: ATP synthase F1 subunit delta [Ignavibacteriales bacterium]|nr:ATP synthase F1 subunit delta [Ignavibacteriales bacterium]
MSVYRISYRYANSLMQLAEEKKIYSKIAQDADLIYFSLEASKELRTVLKSPVIKSTAKKNILTKIYENKISKETESFLEFVVEKGREDILFDVFKEFINLRNKKEGILRAKVVSAVELNDSVKKKITSKLEKETEKIVQSKFVVDERIIGGFVAELEDTVYDASVRHQLKLLRKKFAEEISI